MVTFDELASGGEAIAVVGLGYVGLPLAAAFAKKARVIGFDISRRKVEELSRGHDATGELSFEELSAVSIEYSADPAVLSRARFLIVAVPTPIDASRRPDLSPVEGAARLIGKHLSPGSVVVLESTVYPGVTEEVMAPLLEKESGLTAGRDFFVGYSPERINPGDKVHTVDKIVKVVSGMDEPTLDLVARVYAMVVAAGVHRAPSIRVAEAAKVIENTQRDINIALMNELSIIFEKLGLRTGEVLAAAGTKWNFLPFTPGLVGGHCIGVDPYYLTFKAESVGHLPEVILAGRRINDSMGKYVAENAVKQMIRAGKAVRGSRALVLGLTFKENVPDIRNSKVVDIVRELEEYGVEVQVHDPLADPRDAGHEYGIELIPLDRAAPADVVVLAVAHDALRALAPRQLAAFCAGGNGQGVLVDVKGLVRPEEAKAVGLRYWGLL